jgi:hypothetical protein
MRSIITAMFLVIPVASFGQVQPVNGELAAKFFLATCIPAVDDPAGVEKMASENGWTKLPRPPAPSGVRLPRASWRVDGFFVTTWAPGDDSGNPDVPACFVFIRPASKIKLDEFVDAISASLQLKHFKVETRDEPRLRLRQETYEIIGTKRRAVFSSNDDGSTITGATIYTVNLP